MVKLIAAVLLGLAVISGCDSSRVIQNATVTRVVDGDTVEMSNGDTIRIVGIDTPERGQCGFQEATEIMEGLVLNKNVKLINSALKEKDRYGRLLRYVEVNGQDVGAELIRSGRAIARYDSRDGYGRHPRERFYTDLDKSTPNKNICYPKVG